MVEIAKLEAVRAVGLPADLFADVAPKVLDGWRARAVKEIWVVGAESWRNPDQDLPQDFDERRAENYRELRKPVDPTAFITGLRGEMTAALDELTHGAADAGLGGHHRPGLRRDHAEQIRSRGRASQICAGSRPRCSAGGEPWP